MYMRKHRVNTEKLRKCQNFLNFTTNPHTSVYCTVYCCTKMLFRLAINSFIPSLVRMRRRTANINSKQ